MTERQDNLPPISFTVDEATLDQEADALLLSIDESYVEQEHRPTHLDEVFERARSLQAELGSYVFESIEEAEECVEKYIAMFQAECEAKGVLWRPVRLTGEGILVPHVSHRPFEDTAIVVNVPPEAIRPDLALSIQESGVDGTFGGIGYRLEQADAPVDDETSSDSTACRVELRYKVKCNDFECSYVGMDLFTTGGVLKTEIEFGTDRERRERDEIIARLCQGASAEAAQVIYRLDEVLGVGVRDLTAETLTRASTLVNRLTCLQGFVDNLHAHDDIVALFRHHIDMESIYTLTTPDALKVIDGDYIPVVASEDEPLCFDQEMSDIVLAPRYGRDGYTLLMTDNDFVPYFVVENDVDILYLPMGRTTGFFAVG